MKRTTALACVNKVSTSGLASLRRRMREGAMDKAQPRVWMEALEVRVMMDATAATIDLDPSFGQGGYAAPLPVGVAPSNVAYDHLTPAPDGKFYAIAYGPWAIWPVGFNSL